MVGGVLGCVVGCWEGCLWVVWRVGWRVVCCGGWWWVGMNIIREYNSFWGGGFAFMLVRSLQFLKREHVFGGLSRCLFCLILGPVGVVEGLV